MARLEIFEVVGGIWCVRRRPSLRCSYIVKTSPGAVLVDAGANPSGADVMMALQKARVGLSSVRALLLTHGHYHQAAGARALKSRSGTKVFYHRAEAELLGSSRKRPPLLRRLFSSRPPAVDADSLLDDGDRVHQHFEVVETPGHTAGHLAFYFPPNRALFTGDAMTLRRSGRIDPGRGARDREAAKRSLIRLLRDDVELLLPAHGEPLTTGVPELLERARDRLERRDYGNALTASMS